ncbi:hypothetical protein [Solidesulfovibrio carbinolicus]|uniref:hypothetical protein n=1 Tax=Solidesulfovibrio carbinolicus TaxID=296842 RepID=UPI0010111371|nr:hypothetical protein [Solidesulfovibrio carbinolicus]
MQNKQILSDRWGKPVEASVFIQNLSAEQQSVFLHLIHEIASVDGVVALEEQHMMDIFQSQMPGIVPIKCSHEELSKVFNSKRVRVSAFLEIAAIAQAESGINIEERQYLDSLAAAFDLKDFEVDDMISWVVRQFNLISEAQAFMED